MATLGYSLNPPPPSTRSACGERLVKTLPAIPRKSVPPHFLAIPFFIPKKVAFGGNMLRGENAVFIVFADSKHTC